MGTAIERLIELDERESEQQRERADYLSMMDAVIEALPDALIVTDPDGKVVLFNKRAELMFGYPRSEMIGEPVEKLLPERDRIRHAHDREIYNQFEISQRSRTMGVGMDLMGLRRDGREFPAEITLARMVGSKGVFNLALIRFSPRRILVAGCSVEPEQASDGPDA